MSGHSKWSTIKRQKGVADNKRGQMFTKYGRSITLAVRESGGVIDPSSNFKLRLAMDRAKQINMPKENMQRAIDRGTGKGTEGDIFESIVYEGFGPEGVAIIIESTTDNKMRTVAQIKHVLDRNGGSLGSPGSVVYQFENQGYIIIDKNSINEDVLFDVSVEAGAIDVSSHDDAFEVTTKKDDLHVIKDILDKKSAIISDADLAYFPTNYIDVEESKRGKIIALVDQLEELDDVQKVYTNMNDE